MGTGGSNRGEGELSEDTRRVRHAQAWRTLIHHSFALIFYTPILIRGAEYEAGKSNIIMAQTGSETMRIVFATKGGLAYFPGLAKPVVIETNQLSEAEAHELGELVAAARFFDQPAQIGGTKAPGAADYRQYTITIEQGDRHHTLLISEPIDNSELLRLVRFLEARAKELRTKARKGSAP